MTRSASLAVQPPRPLRLAAGAGVALGVAALVASVFLAIASAAAGQTGAVGVPLDLWHLLRMTSIQAGLSTVLSLAVGVAIAWALNRLDFPGRGLLVGLFASAIVTPGLVVAFGLLAVWGRSGWVAVATGALFGAPLEVPLFGLGGILAAHVILDGALAARILLVRLDAIPLNRLRTGQSLGLGAVARFAIIDWPAIRTTLPGLGAIIFLLAFTSFPIVLLLGGGPANQTLEVAIYSAVRLDFNLANAVILALAQVGVCALVILGATAFAAVPSAMGASSPSPWPDGGAARALQWLVLGLATAGFALPLLAVLIDGLGAGLAGLLVQPAFWAATATSLALAAASALLSLTLALALGMGRAAARGAVLRIALGVPAFAYLAVPAMVLALGAFLLVRGIGLPPAAAAAPVVIIGNALLALPFAVATIGPALEAIATREGRLLRSLGLSGWRQFIEVEWPLLGRDIGVALALSFCFSLGDLGIISLFGTQDFATLPLLMLRALGAYRNNDAAAIAALMLLGTVLAFATLPPLIERIARARTR